MRKKNGLVLEGGSQRGIFTAGVLDYFMEKNLIFPYVVGTGAGAANAVGYIAGQNERMKEIMTYNGPDAYIGKSAKQRCKSMIDLEMLFSKYPYDQFPLDFAAYFSSGIRSEYVVTNVATGKADYLNDANDEKRLLEIMKASAAFPTVTPPVYIGGVPYFDGAVTDPIPVKRAFMKGCQKCVVVLTKQQGSLTKQPINENAPTSVVYRKYADFIKAFNSRRTVYESRMELISYLEKAGMIYVIRPTMPEIGRFETDPEKLGGFYQHGYDVADKCFDEILAFLGEQKVENDD